MDYRSRGVNGVMHLNPMFQYSNKPFFPRGSDGGAQHHNGYLTKLAHDHPHLACERTLMAWMRTGVGVLLISFGFTITLKFHTRSLPWWLFWSCSSGLRP